MVKTAALIKKIRKAAKDAGLEFELAERTNHTGIRVGSKRTTIGSHTETPDLMAETICKQLEVELERAGGREALHFNRT